MFEKISYNNALIIFIPGWFILSVFIIIFYLKFPNSNLNLPDYDLLLSFMFFALSLTIWEILQTFARWLDKIINIFFKWYRPSEIFLLKDNPIINEFNRLKFLKLIKLKKVHTIKLINYKKIKIISWVTVKNDNFSKLSQWIFWEYYWKLDWNQKIINTNARYLFTRVMFVVFWFLWFLFLFIDIKWFSKEINILWSISFFISFLFIYRARWNAKGLINDLVILTIKKIWK